MQPPIDAHKVLKSRFERRSNDPSERPASEGTGKAFPTVKAVAVLEAMATAKRPLRISEFGALLGLPKPTAHRIVRLLEGEGLLQREPGSSRYVPGVRLERLGLDIVAASMSRAPRHAILESLSQQIGETCNLGIMAGSHLVYLDRVESAWPFGLRFERGSHVPLHCTSMGKLFLSQLPAHKRTLMLRSIPLYRYTENTITDVGRLEEELVRIRSAEVSTDDQEFLAGVVCVAVPVHGPKKQPVAALAVSAPLARMSLQEGVTHIPLLRAAADSLAATIEQYGNAKEEENS